MLSFRFSHSLSTILNIALVSSEKGNFLFVTELNLGVKSIFLKCSETMSYRLGTSTLSSLKILTHSFESSINIDNMICSGLNFMSSKDSASFIAWLMIDLTFGDISLFIFLPYLFYLLFCKLTDKKFIKQA